MHLYSGRRIRRFKSHILHSCLCDVPYYYIDLFFSTIQRARYQMILFWRNFSARERKLSDCKQLEQLSTLVKTSTLCMNPLEPILTGIKADPRLFLADLQSQKSIDQSGTSRGMPPLPILIEPLCNLINSQGAKVPYRKLLILPVLHAYSISKVGM